MPPLTRIGLARLVLLLVCASAVVLADVRYGCATGPTCPVKDGFAGGVLKCHRCHDSIEYLMDLEDKAHAEENQVLCQDMVSDKYDEDGFYKYYTTPESEINECLTASFLLYDGASECHALRRSKQSATVVKAIRRCIGKLVGFYNCLCLAKIDDSHIQSLTPCFFKGGNVPNMLEKCPKHTRSPTMRFHAKDSSKNGRLKVPGSLMGVNRRSTVDDGSNTSASNGDTSDGYIDGSNDGYIDGSNDGSSDGSNDGSGDGANDGSGDGSNDGSSDGSDDGSNVEYYVDDWPPALSDQFSPVLDDDGVSFYLDIYERIVLVNTTTMEVLYYEPYYLYTALSYDTVFPAEKDDSIARNLVRRCWLYPYSDRVWCYQWYMPTTDLRAYGYEDSATATILGPSEAASGVTASTGDTAAPTAYTSVEYTTAGTVPSATTRTVTEAPATTASPGSTAKPTKGSSSAPASRAASRHWLAGILFAVIMHGAF